MPAYQGDVILEPPVAAFEPDCFEVGGMSGGGFLSGSLGASPPSEQLAWLSGSESMSPPGGRSLSPPPSPVRPKRPARLFPAPPAPPSPAEQTVLRKVDAWRRRNRNRLSTKAVKPHPLNNVLGARPADWRVLVFEMRTWRWLDATERATRAAQLGCIALTGDDSLEDRLVTAGTAVVQEGKHMADMVEELIAVCDVIEYLISETPFSLKHGLPEDFCQPLADIGRELAIARTRIVKNQTVLADVREQMGAAFADISDTAPATFPLWALDVYARPARRFAVRNEAERDLVQTHYATCNESLRWMFHEQLSMALRKLAVAQGKIAELRQTGARGLPQPKRG